MVKFLYATSLIVLFLVTSCSSKESTVLLENDLRTWTDIKGPVKSWSGYFYDVAADSGYTRANKFKNELCCIDIGARDHTYDSLGGSIKRVSGKTWEIDDNFDSIGDTHPTTVFHKVYSLSPKLKEFKFETAYHKDIIQPILARRNEIRFHRMGENNWRDRTIDSSKSFYKDSYYYKIDDKDRIVEQKLNTAAYHSEKKAFIYRQLYKEIIKYTYDEKDRIINQEHSFDQELDQDFEDTLVLKLDKKFIKDLYGDNVKRYEGYLTPYNTLGIDFKYNDQGKVIEAALNNSGTPTFKENYTYHKNGQLKTRTVTTDQVRYSYRTRTPKAIYSYNSHGSMVHLQEFDEQDNIVGEQWVDYYEYDQYDNWTRCEVFLSGTHEGEPDLIGYRKYEYFK